VFLLTLLACSGVVLTDAERAELEKLKTEAEANALPLELKRREVLAAAKGVVGPRPDMGPCPVGVLAPTDEDQGQFADNGKSFHLGTVPISVVQAKDVAEAEGPRYDRVGTALINDVQSMLYHAYRAADRQEIDDGLARARQLTDPKWLNVDATLVIDRWSEPAAEGDKFQTGWLVGRFYVYSYDESAIICAADVRAENSDELGVRLHYKQDGGFQAAQSDLLRDLYRNGVQQGIDGLSKAGPWMMALQ
jgi:hypothetical protein